MARWMLNKFVLPRVGGWSGLMEKTKSAIEVGSELVQVIRRHRQRQACRLVAGGQAEAHPRARSAIGIAIVVARGGLHLSRGAHAPPRLRRLGQQRLLHRWQHAERRQ